VSPLQSFSQEDVPGASLAGRYMKTPKSFACRRQFGFRSVRNDRSTKQSLSLDSAHALITALIRDRRGATAIEYGLLIGLVSLVLLSSLPLIETGLKMTFDSLNAGMAAAGHGGAVLEESTTVIVRPDASHREWETSQERDYVDPGRSRPGPRIPSRKADSP
jgi:pilus assembly protein Flp/PilA